MKSKIFFIVLLSILTLSAAGCGSDSQEFKRPKSDSNVQSKVAGAEQTQQTEDAEQQPVTENYNTPITIAGEKIMAEIVNTPSSKQLGLSFRKNLADDYGMLFDFTDTPNAMPSFWMKDMNFDIDIIWINSGKIIGVAKNVPAVQTNGTNVALPRYSPPSSITHVLEVRAGWYDENKIKIGDGVKI